MLLRNHAMVAAMAALCVLFSAFSARAEDANALRAMLAQGYAVVAGIPPIFSVTKESHHDTLPSLRDALPPPQNYGLREHFEGTLPYPPGSTNQVDSAVQNRASPTFNVPGALTSFDGVGNGFNGPQGTFAIQFAPPDTDGAVGATQYVSLVNTGLAVFDKTMGNVIFGPIPTNTLWTGFGGGCESNDDGDGVVIYDRAANRWVISQFSYHTLPYLQCVAVSQTSDATGGWYRYSFAYGSTNFPDYPKMGSWPDAYYETFNVFAGSSSNPFGNLCAYDRTSMLAGNAATQQCFQLSTQYTGVLPSDLDGPTPPPAGSPNYLINFGTNSLNLWKFHVDWTTPSNSTLTGPANIPVASFAPACNHNNGICVKQPPINATTLAAQLDTLADRLMFRFAYRNFGDHESLVVSQSVKLGSGTSQYSGVRWYEIRNPGGAPTPTVYQQSTFAPDTSFRWMPSIAMDGAGDIALGYSVSSTSLYPSVRYTGRMAGDAPNAMGTEVNLISGSGSQIAGLDRWGDYSAMTVDPVDDCTFWYTNEYIPSNGSYNWKTRIASFKFPSCTTPVTYTLTYITDGNGTISGATPQAGVAYGSGGTAVTAVPNTGYHFAQWSDASTADPRTDANVTTNISVTAQFAANLLVFTTQPASLMQGSALGTIAVTEQDGSGNTVADIATVDFTIVTACGTVDLGSVAMVNGVATLNSVQRFQLQNSGYQIIATVTNPNPTPIVAVTSDSFAVNANSDFIFNDGFDGCRL